MEKFTLTGTICGLEEMIFEKMVVQKKGLHKLGRPLNYWCARQDLNPA
jgi:hypothetical protein